MGNMAIAELQELVDVASHEMRGALNALNLHMHLIEHQALQGTAMEPATFLRGRRLVRRLSRVIEELVELARLQQGRVELCYQDFDLREVVRQAVIEIDPQRAGDVHVDMP